MIERCENSWVVIGTTLVHGDSTGSKANLKEKVQIGIVQHQRATWVTLAGALLGHLKSSAKQRRLKWSRQVVPCNFLQLAIGDVDVNSVAIPENFKTSIGPMQKAFNSEKCNF